MLQSLPSDESVEATLCDASEVATLSGDWHADLVLVEAVSDLGTGMDIVRMLAAVIPEVPVVILGNDGDELSVYGAISAGAVGYLTRDASPKSLLATLQAVRKGELGISPVAAARVVQHLVRTLRTQESPLNTEVPSRLTRREREIFDLLRQGLRSREIGARLCIAEVTVYKHVQNILQKLQVHSRIQAVLVADDDTPRAGSALV